MTEFHLTLPQNTDFNKIREEPFGEPIRRRIHRYPKRMLILLLVGISVIILYTNWNNEIDDIVNNMQVIRNRKHNLRNETLAETLEREVRVLCWVMTTPENHKTKALHVLHTWGKRCTRLFFVTSKTDDEFETIIVPIEDKYEFLWGKTREAFRYIYNNHFDEADWFMKADDDTFVFVENLRYLLYEYSPDMPIHFGYNFKLDNKNISSYMSGGGGYILSKEALSRFVEIGLNDSTKCRINENNNAEDVEIGKCLLASGVVAGDGRDKFYKQRFSPFEPFATLIPNYYGTKFWYYGYSFYHVHNCRDCLSKYVVSFHYVASHNMDVYNFLKYDLEVFGLDELEEEDVLPEKLIFDEIKIPESDNSIEYHF
ncbi:glycoprotein-N-acetylgalactosamine 3-beta-galactosyltransferase 1-like [Teleopsis dalmanni]|uniref:glycoprotein-N-acetylgalactosamine 3-beta-galactosyltransferase 1-like n=1 Tax=Teleopsis dalmanni TaxID=139649 RepID=UPI0018CFB042|nr:glycoprotein-N-acetylgalactosamine 3-beta-galactosyltransferase 1-like [Teleopsis dalmanni]